MTDSFQPRIVVSDEEDWEIVTAALVDFTVGIYSRARMGGADLMHVVHAALRASELLVALGEQREGDELRKEFGAVPDDISTIGEGIGE